VTAYLIKCLITILYYTMIAIIINNPHR